MTRILYWNIEKFGINKIANPNNKRQRGAAISQAQASAARLAYLRRNLDVRLPGNIAAPPQIIVVVEVSTGYTQRGDLVQLGGGGAQGSIRLLAEIRNLTGNANWMLIPPLQTGPREAVAVYFDSTNLVFTGPWRWPGGTGPSFAPGAGPGVLAYNDGIFNACLPAAAVPPTSTRNANLPQNQLAAATDFTYLAGPNAGQPIDYGQRRSPYWVTFAELGPPPVPPGARPILREISLFAIHSPANAAARAYLRGLANVAEIANAMAANEARIIAGDFNVNLLGPAPNLTRDAAYAPIGLLYTLGINRTLAFVPAAGSEGYFATHMKGRKNAKYWSQFGALEYYPGYNYIGSEVQNQAAAVGWYSIDNIMARYGGGPTAGGPIANVTILSGIVGSPFNLMATAGAPAGPPLGHYTLPITMALATTTFVLPPQMFFVPPPPPMPPYPPPYNQAPYHTIGRQSAFRGWDNYGRIRSTSDHLAIVADV